VFFHDSSVSIYDFKASAAYMTPWMNPYDCRMILYDSYMSKQDPKLILYDLKLFSATPG
jgi:hypothetical protein